MKNGILILGRFTVFHVGHYSLIKSAKMKYPNDELVIAIVQGVKSSKDINKNPTSFDERKTIINRVLLKNNIHSIIIGVNTGYIPDIIENIKHDHEIDIKVVYCGTDRLGTYQEQLNRAGLNDVQLEEIKRNLDNDSEDDGDMVKKASATEVRKYVKENDFDNFKSMMPIGLDEEDMNNIWSIMRTAFKEKGLINHIITSGITHLEDLEIDEFIHFVENFYTDNIVKIQKLDGTFNMSIVKQNDDIYYSRVSKKQTKPFTKDSLPQSPIYNALRSACMACDVIKNKLKDILENGDIVDCEVLYSKQPNTIVYNLDKNYLAFLRMLSGDQSKIESLYKTLKGDTVTIDVPTYFYNWDINNIDIRQQKDVWSFTMPQTIASIEGEIPDQLEIFKQWLEAKNDIIPEKTNFEVLKISLSTTKKIYREQYRQARESAIEEANKMKINIKQNLIDNVLKKINFDLGGTNQEGIVLRDDDLKLITKLIDKEGFTKLNKLNWKYIEQSTKGIKLSDGTWIPGLISTLNKTISEVLNIPILVNPNQFVNYCKRQTGLDSDILAINRFVESMNVDNTSSINSKLLIINNQIKPKLNSILELLKESKNDNELSDRMKERTSDSLGLVYNKLKDLSDLITKLTSNDTMNDNTKLTTLLMALANIGESDES